MLMWVDKESSFQHVFLISTLLLQFWGLSTKTFSSGRDQCHVKQWRPCPWRACTELSLNLWLALAGEALFQKELAGSATYCEAAL